MDFMYENVVAIPSLPPSCSVHAYGWPAVIIEFSAPLTFLLQFIPVSAMWVAFLAITPAAVTLEETPHRVTTVLNTRGRND